MQIASPYNFSEHVNTRAIGIQSNLLHDIDHCFANLELYYICRRIQPVMQEMVLIFSRASIFLYRYIFYGPSALGLQPETRVAFFSGPIRIFDSLEFSFMMADLRLKNPIRNNRSAGYPCAYRTDRGASIVRPSS